MQAQLSDILLLCTYSTMPSTPGASRVSNNTRKAFKKFCNGLYEIGVTTEMVRQKKKKGEILNIFKPENTATSTGNCPGSKLTFIY